MARPKRRSSLVVRATFRVFAGNDQELDEVLGLLEEELDSAADNVVDILMTPGNYDVTLKHKHEDTGVTFEEMDF